MLRFFKEVHLFLGSLPHFVNDSTKINQISGSHGKIQKTGSLLHQSDILSHRFLDSRTLHFQHPMFTGL